ncbi:hypothetical protein MNBD_GAMMA06-2258 [hydrothermal vent metagenome]|uniref:Outer membrane protein beta-barrel domain-containing protein n=1 Tax=hydrothermal vent metagenome TaxID=652676 RepID=A0A3B0WMB9_9ZZZZ
MVIKLKLKYLILLAFLGLPFLFSSTANAEVYIGLATTQIQIKTNTGSTRPLMADARFGYRLNAHKFELAVMSSVKDDNLNQLVIDVPIATSLLYRYTTNPRSPIRVDFILGYSQVDIKSSYIDIPESTETFRGVSFGIGFEQSLDSIRQLKFKIDLMQMYRGDQLDINAITLGFRYEF